jgi:hypothetical protein
MKLRVRGIASPPFDYDVRHDRQAERDYILVREHVKNRDGSDLVGAPGFVDHRYLYDGARERFELVRSQPEDSSFDTRMFVGIGDPLGFLERHWQAVCNGKLAFLDARRSADSPSQAEPTPTVTAGPTAVTGRPDRLKLLSRWDDLNDKCRGGAGDLQSTERACNKREDVDAQLRQSGMCYGHAGEFEYQAQWHVCGPHSCGVVKC